MNLNKYSVTRDGSTVVGSYADRKSSLPSSPQSSQRLNRELWGQADTGDDIDGDMLVNGNVYLGELQYDDDENVVRPDHSFPSEQGNLYAGGSVASPQVYGGSLFLDINGVRTNLLDVLMPVGSVIMFNGASAVPPNWAICDGTNGTPNLKNRFIRGVTDKADVGKTGGAATVDMGNVLPKHTHTFANFLTQVNGNDEINTGDLTIGGKQRSVGFFSHEGNPTKRAQTSDGGHSDIPFITNETDAAGSDVSGSTVDILPPYYSLIYIMRIK